jgi:hypothetical protein
MDPGRVALGRGFSFSGVNSLQCPLSREGSKEALSGLYGIPVMLRNLAMPTTWKIRRLTDMTRSFTGGKIPVIVHSHEVR